MTNGFLTRVIIERKNIRDNKAYLQIKNAQLKQYFMTPCKFRNFERRKLIR